MKRIVFSVLVLSALLGAAERKPARGQAGNDTVAIVATVVSPDQVKAAIPDLHGNFTVLDVQLTPRDKKTLDIRLDDFVLRSQSDGDHSGALAAGQVADGGGALEVQQTFAARSNPDDSQVVASSKVEMKNGAAKTNQLEALKKKILSEASTTEPVEGWLFFPLERQKPKNLALIYATPQGKLRVEFK